jgi:KipI family sensor histidine kinase inhibitor
VSLAPRVRPAGDSAITVEFAEEISSEVNEAVQALDAAIRAEMPPGVIETIPTYRSLLVTFDPTATDPEALGERVLELAAARTASRRRDRRRWFIPACFGGEFGLDLRDVAARVGLAPAEVVRRHCETDYRVYMIGFSPGFAYLGGLPAELRLPRREDPRLSTPAGSVMQGGDQAAISPLAMPSGWHLLGRTPVPIFDLRRPRRPFLLAPGDRVRFEAVSP